MKKEGRRVDTKGKSEEYLEYESTDSQRTSSSHASRSDACGHVTLGTVMALLLLCGFYNSFLHYPYSNLVILFYNGIYACTVTLDHRKPDEDGTCAPIRLESYRGEVPSSGSRASATPQPQNPFFCRIPKL